MKILVLNGSPKRDKSDTMHITRAFLDGMKEAAPQDIHIIHTVDQHIEYCTGCFSCMRNGGSCIHIFCCFLSLYIAMECLHP